MSAKREFTGVFIPAHIWESKDLTPAEKMMLGEIDALSKTRGYCDASRQHFADWLHCTPQNITYMWGKLEGMGFIKLEKIPGERNKIYMIPERFYIQEGVNPIYGGGKSHLRGGVNPIYGGGKRDLPEIKEKYKNEIQVERITETRVSEPSKNQETKNEIPEPKSEKKSKRKTPGGRAGAGVKTENWAKRAAQIFDEVNREKATEAKIEFIPYEWRAKSGQDFKSLKGIKEMIESAITQKGIEPTSENIENSFRLFFRCGFDYMHEIAERLGGPITFSPSTLQRNYNQIRQFSTNKFKRNATHKRDNGPGNGSSGTGRYGIDINRAMQDVSNILNDREFMASFGA